MRPRRLSDVAEAVSGRLQGPDRTVSRVVVDSREAGPGDLFVALRGERADGHDFVAEALEREAEGAVVARPVEDLGPLVVVEDPARALLDLAAHERGGWSARVVGITGSTGKTSVKDMAAAVLDTRFRVAASPRSYNTEVGVPLTLLGAPPEAEVIVCEMGSRGRGHIAQVAEVARPAVGVVTNVGVAHMELFGSAEAIAEAKAELVEALPEEGTAILNADDPVVRAFASRTPARVLLFGTGPGVDVGAEDVVLDPMGRASFALRTPAGRERVELSIPGEHMVSNALAAAATGVALGLSAGECAAGLKDAQLSAWRMELREGPEGILVVNDAYNANPVSMAAALRTARWMAAERRCVAVLGEMAELGEIARDRHERVGELVARLGIDVLVTVGGLARLIGVGAAREGVEPDRVVACDTLEEAESALRGIVRPGDLVLLKGSRVAGLERLAPALAPQPGEEGAG